MVVNYENLVTDKITHSHFKSDLGLRTVFGLWLVNDSIEFVLGRRSTIPWLYHTASIVN